MPNVHAPKAVGICANPKCGLRRSLLPRGLCKKCYYDKRVDRTKFPTKYKPSGGKAEMTEAELDALIAAQLPTMPGESGTGNNQYYGSPHVPATLGPGKMLAGGGVRRLKKGHAK